MTECVRGSVCRLSAEQESVPLFLPLFLSVPSFLTFPLYFFLSPCLFILFSIFLAGSSFSSLVVYSSLSSLSSLPFVCLVPFLCSDSIPSVSLVVSSYFPRPAPLSFLCFSLLRYFFHPYAPFRRISPYYHLFLFLRPPCTRPQTLLHCYSCTARGYVQRGRLVECQA